jgi:hypothetical protein
MRTIASLTITYDFPLPISIISRKNIEKISPAVWFHTENVLERKYA